MTLRPRRRASLAIRARLVPGVLLGAALGGCFHYESRALGRGGVRVTSVREGTAVDVRFAEPRTFPGRRGLDRVVRVRGTVDRTSGDTMVVRVEGAAPLGGGVREVDPAISVPIVIGRDTAVRVRTLSRTRTLLIALGGLLAAVAFVAAS